MTKSYKKAMHYFFLPAGLFMAIFLIFPLLKLVYDSFFDIANDGSRTFVWLANYTKSFASSTFHQVSKNTLIYVLVAVSVQTILGLFLAVVLTHKLKGFKAIRTFMLSPLMIAPIVAGIIWRFMMSNQFGIVNTMLVNLGLMESTNSVLWLADPNITLFSVIIAEIWLSTPFMMLMFLAGIQGIPEDLYEAAMLEGASKIQMIFKIIIPNIKPVLYSAIIVRVIDAARSFDIVWAMTQGGPNQSSELLSVYIYKMLQRYGDVGLASAMSVIFIIVLVSIALISRKSIND